MRPFTDVRIAASYAMIRRPAKTTLDTGGEWNKAKGALSKLGSAMSAFGRGWTFWRRAFYASRNRPEWRLFSRHPACIAVNHINLSFPTIDRARYRYRFFHFHILLLFLHVFFLRQFWFWRYRGLEAWSNHGSSTRDRRRMSHLLGSTGHDQTSTPNIQMFYGNMLR